MLSHEQKSSLYQGHDVFMAEVKKKKKWSVTQYAVDLNISIQIWKLIPVRILLAKACHVAKPNASQVGKIILSQWGRRTFGNNNLLKSSLAGWQNWDLNPRNLMWWAKFLISRPFCLWQPTHLYFSPIFHIRVLITL